MSLMLVNCFRTSYPGDRNETQAGCTSHKDETSYKHRTSSQTKHVTLLNQVCKEMSKTAVLHIFLQLEVIKQLLLQDVVVTLDTGKSEILPNYFVTAVDINGI